ncbi:uncharacterized protein LOC108931029 isoform X4 [Scleropages formosus]|uniref:uncharacterized protein LOC108931029 isoform X4 n=1 Tax=Scleropages formosus TaxID=113540 RepID=UPI0010FAB7EA|nr:uncharacterized protein LOC108931029 isoform X4 [Scleropages formosus]
MTCEKGSMNKYRVNMMNFSESVKMEGKSKQKETEKRRCSEGPGGAGSREVVKKKRKLQDGVSPVRRNEKGELVFKEQNYKDVWKELPEDWLGGLDIAKQVASSTYRKDVNTYKVKCGGSLEMWESSGWIVPQDPYGWFQWYCRFHQGRRTDDDERQVGRWAKCTGPKGRWRNNLITKIVRSGCAFHNCTVSPVVRQTLQHWAYRLTKQDYDMGAKRVKLK